MASALALQCSTSLSYEDPYAGGRPIYWVHQPVKGMKHRMKWCELREYKWNEHVTIAVNAEATGSNPVEAPKNFFSGYFRYCLNCDSLRWSHAHFICIPAVHYPGYQRFLAAPFVTCRPKAGGRPTSGDAARKPLEKSGLIYCSRWTLIILIALHWSQSQRTFPTVITCINTWR